MIMCEEQMYKELGRKRVWVGGLDLWEEQSPIDKKLLLFKSGRAGLTTSGNTTSTHWSSTSFCHYLLFDTTLDAHHIYQGLGMKQARKRYVC